MLINYPTLRSHNIRFLTDSPKLNRHLKLTGVMALLAILSTIYAMIYITIGSVMSIFFLSAFSAILLDMTGKSSYNKRTLMYIAVVLVGVFLVIRPPFIYGHYGIRYNYGSFNYTRQVDTKNEVIVDLGVPNFELFGMAAPESNETF